MLFQFGGFFAAPSEGEPEEPDARTLVLRALENVEDVGSHLWLTETLVRALAELDAEEDENVERTELSAG